MNAMLARFLLLAGLVTACVAPLTVRAANAAYLNGTVVADGHPVAGATITVSGNNVVVHARSDTTGRFVMVLALGSYDVEATDDTAAAHLRVDLGNGGATLTLALQHLQVIGGVTVVRSPSILGSGADRTLDATELTRSPQSGSFPEALIQLPGAARGANGVVHMNGDHGVIDYLIDGVPLPQALNREVGSEIDPNDVSFVDVVEGAYPAQYGLRFGSVLNITTRAGTGAPGFDGAVNLGSYTDLDETLGYHAPIDRGGISIAVRNQRSTRGLDPPNFDSPHNDTSDTNQFLRLTLPRGANAYTDITLIHNFRTFQIPNDVDHGEPATTDDSEKQNDTFVSAQFRQPFGEEGSWSFGPAVKISRITDYGDPTNDFRYGEAINAGPPPFGNGGTSTDCASALVTGSFGPTTCGFSLAADKTAVDGIFQSDVARRIGAHHELRGGVSYDLTRVNKTYAITLQPNNFLAPLLTPMTPNASTTVVDTNPNVGNTYQSYLQDHWRISDLYTLDDGLRYDFFTISSTDFTRGFGAFSPRLKLTRFFGKRASVYAYVGRFFEPFSFENVAPVTAQRLNLPLQATLAQFDLKPERDTQLEVGAHLPVGAGSLGVRVWQKNANDLIDDTQVGVTLLHQDINFTLGRLSQESLDYVVPFARDGRGYVNVAHTVSLNDGCETQLLAPCFGAPTGFTPADHDQTYSITGGALFNDTRNGWLSGDFEYGSGLSSSICPIGTIGFCKRTPHTILSVEKGIALSDHLAVTARIDNLLNDRYYVTLFNAQGNHVASPRTFQIGVRFGR